MNMNLPCSKRYIKLNTPQVQRKLEKINENIWIRKMATMIFTYEIRGTNTGTLYRWADEEKNNVSTQILSPYIRIIASSALIRM